MTCHFNSTVMFLAFVMRFYWPLLLQLWLSRRCNLWRHGNMDFSRITNALDGFLRWHLPLFFSVLATCPDQSSVRRQIDTDIYTHRWGTAWSLLIQFDVFKTKRFVFRWLCLCFVFVYRSLDWNFLSESVSGKARVQYRAAPLWRVQCREWMVLVLDVGNIMSRVLTLRDAKLNQTDSAAALGSSRVYS